MDAPVAEHVLRQSLDDVSVLVRRARDGSVDRFGSEPPSPALKAALTEVAAACRRAVAALDFDVHVNSRRIGDGDGSAGEPGADGGLLETGEPDELTA